MGTARPGWVEQRVDRVVAYIGRSERHRVGFVISVSLLFFIIAVANSYFGGLVPLIFNAVLLVFLYTRSSARTTVTASATASGLLFIALFLYRVTGLFEGPVGGYEPFTSLVLRNGQLLGIGVLLVVLGLWLRKVTS